jgi:ABC-type cobalamin/Fe3+-siderophores transport system ATPase subunit
MVPLTVLKTDNQLLSIDLCQGETLYVLGANGSGKSTLLFEWAKKDVTSNLVAGNREISFASPAVVTNASESAQQETAAKAKIQNNASARFNRMQHNDQSWLNGLVFKLKSLGEHKNELYVQADRDGRAAEKEKLHANMPIKLLNNAFISANLKISMSWDAQSNLNVKKDNIDDEYGFNAMSDGERSAFIITACAILAGHGSMVLLDEPERHLHRSISSPLMSYLRRIRPDLNWVISTHDLSLPRGDESAKLLLLYAFSGSKWSAELVNQTSPFDPHVANAIYGAREKVIFVEGNAETSLDLPLYKMFFEGMTIVPTGSCKDVRSSVIALNGADALHHMEAVGIVDADNRHDIDALQADRVAVLGVYAIESIYYHPAVVEALIQTAGTASSCLDILNEACATITDGDIERLAKDAVYKSFRQSFDRKRLTSYDYWQQTSEFQLNFDDPSIGLNHLVTELTSLRDQKKWLSLIQKMKIKATPSMHKIATKLGYLGTHQYEIAAKKIIDRTETLREDLQTVIPNPFSELQ